MCRPVWKTNYGQSPTDRSEKKVTGDTITEKVEEKYADKRRERERTGEHMSNMKQRSKRLDKVKQKSIRIDRFEYEEGKGEKCGCKKSSRFDTNKNKKQIAFVCYLIRQNKPMDGAQQKKWYDRRWQVNAHSSRSSWTTCTRLYMY